MFKVDEKDHLTLETKNKDKAVKLLQKLSDEFCWGILLDDFPKQGSNILVIKPKLASPTEVCLASAAYWLPNSSDAVSVTNMEDLTQDILNVADTERNITAVMAFFAELDPL